MPARGQVTDCEPPPRREHLYRAARGHLLAYALACDPQYAAGRFHDRLAGILSESILKKERKRIIIASPPRHGKSRLSQEASAFVLGHRPWESVVVASYGRDLSIKSSRDVRRRLAFNEMHKTLFPDCRVRSNESRADSWTTSGGGSFTAVGVGGALTGLGATTLILDDVHKNRAEAESKTMRDNVWDWFLSTAYTRLSPDGVLIVIGTRWHKDDLVGRLTDPRRMEELSDAGAGSETFDVYNFAALANDDRDPLGRRPGECLWPEKWPVERLTNVRAAMGTYEWSALYMGDPRDREANAALVAGLKFCSLEDVPSAPSGRCWDLAVEGKDKDDFHAGPKGVWDRTTGDFYLTHMARLKGSWFTAKSEICRWGDIDGGRIRLEAVGAFKIAYEEVRKERSGKNSVSFFQPRTDKFTRALPWFALIEAGKFHVVRGEWNAAFIDELQYFPGGMNDDQIDAVSGLVEWLRAPQAMLLA